MAVDFSLISGPFFLPLFLSPNFFSFPLPLSLPSPGVLLKEEEAPRGRKWGRVRQEEGETGRVGRREPRLQSQTGRGVDGPVRDRESHRERLLRTS